MAARGRTGRASVLNKSYRPAFPGLEGAVGSMIVREGLVLSGWDPTFVQCSIYSLRRLPWRRQDEELVCVAWVTSLHD